jgi:hypothetical protein
MSHALRRAVLSAVLLTATATRAADDRPLRLDIAPGKIGEVCQPLHAGDTLAWRFKANRPADFNLHHHVDGQVLMPVDLHGVTAHAGEHQADRANDWCLMWTAPRGQRLTVTGRWTVRRATATP